MKWWGGEGVVVGGARLPVVGVVIAPETVVIVLGPRIVKNVPGIAVRSL